MGADAPPGREIFFSRGAEFMGVSCKCTSEDENAPPRRGGVTFLLGGGGSS